MLEYYRAYSSALEERAFVELMVKKVAKAVTGALSFAYDGQLINLKSKFKVIKYYDVLTRLALLPDPSRIELAELGLRARQLGVTVGEGEGREKILDNIYKKVCRPKLIQPTFVVDYPADYLPLAKRLPDEPNLVDAFQLVIGGLELVKAFSELNDPLDQRARFLNQEKQKAAGDHEAQTLDEDYLEALEYGLPPAGGVGLGIDRLTMLLTDTTNIREVIFFPTLRPK